MVMADASQIARLIEPQAADQREFPDMFGGRTFTRKSALPLGANRGLADRAVLSSPISP